MNPKILNKVIPVEDLYIEEPYLYGLDGELAKFLREKGMFRIMARNHGVLVLPSVDDGKDPLYIQVYVKFLRYRMAYFKIVDWTRDCNGDDDKYVSEIRRRTLSERYDLTYVVDKYITLNGSNRKIHVSEFDTTYTPTHSIVVKREIFVKPLDEICLKGVHYRKVLVAKRQEELAYPCHVYHIGVKGRIMIVPTLFGYVAYRYVLFAEVHVLRPRYVADVPLSVDQLYLPLELEIPYYIYHLFVANAVLRTKAWKRHVRKIGKTMVTVETPRGVRLVQPCTVYKCRHCGKYLLGYGHALTHLAYTHHIVSEIVEKIRNSREEAVRSDVPDEDVVI